VVLERSSESGLTAGNSVSEGDVGSEGDGEGERDEAEVEERRRGCKGGVEEEFVRKECEEEAEEEEAIKGRLVSESPDPDSRLELELSGREIESGVDDVSASTMTLECEEVEVRGVEEEVIVSETVELDDVAGTGGSVENLTNTLSFLPWVSMSRIACKSSLP